LSHLYIKMLILPRQARDKHRENSKRDRFVAQYLPLNSLVLSATPAAGDAADVSGIAYSGGSGERVTGVEVSADAGQTWHAMKLRASCLAV
jgi:hypothetical protein